MVSMSGAATGADLIETGIPRWNANVDALRTLKRIEAQGRPATVEERRILEGYSGFGGSEFGPAFDLNTDSRAWNRRGTELRELATEDEYDSITASRLNAFYTTPKSYAICGAGWSGWAPTGPTLYGSLSRRRAQGDSLSTSRIPWRGSRSARLLNWMTCRPASYGLSFPTTLCTTRDSRKPRCPTTTTT